jgi:hypothetical protein
MARPKKKVELPKQEVFYAASTTLLEAEDQMYPEKSIEDAIDYVKDNEVNYKEIFLYEIKLIGKYKVNYNLEKIM